MHNLVNWLFWVAISTHLPDLEGGRYMGRDYRYDSKSNDDCSIRLGSLKEPNSPKHHVFIHLLSWEEMLKVLVPSIEFEHVA